MREELELSDWPDRHDEYDKRSRAALCVQKLRGHRIRKVTSQRYAVVHDLAATSAALTEPVWWNVQRIIAHRCTPTLAAVAAALPP